MRSTDKSKSSIKSPVSSSRSDLGSKGKSQSSGNFADNPELASEAGRKGGKASHRSTSR